VLGNGREHGGQLLTPTLDKDGYPYVTLRDGDREWRVGVAPLVLLTYRGPCPPGHEALHGNDVRQDVDLVNLRWGTHLENERDKRRGREERNGRDEIGMVSRPEMAVSPVSGDLLV